MSVGVLCLLLCAVTFNLISSTDNSTYQLCNEILALGKKIPIVLQELNPAQKDQVILDLKEYNAKMRQMAEIVELDQDNLQGPLSYLLDDGYPKYLGLEVLDEKLRQSFNWTDRDIERFKALRRASYLAYGDLVGLYNKPMKYIDSSYEEEENQ